MSPAPLLAGLQSTVLTGTERVLFRDLDPAGYMLMGRNLESPEQTRALTDALRAIHPASDPIIASSAEALARILPEAPAPASLAAAGNPTAVAECGAFTGDLLRLLGINLHLAPLLDLERDEDLPSPHRWHRDPQRVIDHAGVWNRWLRRRKVRSAAGRFPAGGRGLHSPATLTELLAEDLIPYTALMPEIDAVIIGHQVMDAIDPGRPASLSRRIVTGLLRDQLGFDRHLVLTDDLGRPELGEPHADGRVVTEALHAGVDLVLWAIETDVRQAVAGIREVATPLLQDAAWRIERFRKGLHDPVPWSRDRWAETCGRFPPG